jgi:hypothetical protein
MNKTLYSLKINFVITKDETVLEEGSIPVSYYAESKEEAIVKAQEVGQAMARSAEAKCEAALYYRIMNHR